MAKQSRTQKQIAEKYKGNLGYFKKPNFFRRMRFLLCILALLLGVAGVVFFQEYGSNSFYNAGPLSEKHAHLKQNCSACHSMKKGAVAGLLAMAKSEPDAPDLRAIAKRIFKSGSQDEIDQACLKCHKGFELHQPAPGTRAMRELLGRVPLVHAGSCSSCHREHKGPAPMRVPGNAACASCHADAKRMRAVELLKTTASSQVAQIRQIQHGTLQFIPPQSNPESERLQPDGRSKRPFASFEEGHPPFGYEQAGLRDPNILKFNHQRHEAADIPKVNGQKLDCVFCHKTSGDGSFYQRVTFDAACKPCHALLFDPKNPGLQIPHGEPEAVRAYLRSLPFQYAELASRKGFQNQQQINAFISQQMIQLKDRVRSGEDFEKQVFFTGNPYQAAGTASPRTLFPGCVYCHQVKAGPNGTPLITKPVMADRWLLRGRFTHNKHTEMACADCHDARHSKETSDILMPSIKSCAQCHRAHKPESDAAATIPGPKARQSHGSGECLSCHSFHAGSN